MQKIWRLSIRLQNPSMLSSGNPPQFIGNDRWFERSAFDEREANLKRVAGRMFMT